MILEGPERTEVFDKKTVVLENLNLLAAGSRLGGTGLERLPKIPPLLFVPVKDGEDKLPVLAGPSRRVGLSGHATQH